MLVCKRRYREWYTGKCDAMVGRTTFERTCFRVFPNAKKCWLITKPEKEEEARAVFGATAINITTEGLKHLGAALGSRSYFEEYVGEKVEDWVSQVMKLAEFAVSQPQASYAAFTFGLRHRWTYLLRTLPDITDLRPLERAISDVLIPALLEHQVTEKERDLLALSVRVGPWSGKSRQPVATGI